MAKRKHMVTKEDLKNPEKITREVFVYCNSIKESRNVLSYYEKKGKEWNSGVRAIESIPSEKVFICHTDFWRDHGTYQPSSDFYRWFSDENSITISAKRFLKLVKEIDQEKEEDDAEAVVDEVLTPRYKKTTYMLDKDYEIKGEQEKPLFGKGIKNVLDDGTILEDKSFQKGLSVSMSVLDSGLTGMTVEDWKIKSVEMDGIYLSEGCIVISTNDGNFIIKEDEAEEILEKLTKAIKKHSELFPNI